LKNVDNNTYQLSVPVAKASVVATWLRDLSDGYTSFNVDGDERFQREAMPGPFVVNEVKAETLGYGRRPLQRGVKPWFVGVRLHVKERGAAAVRVE
jgi:hypothetical protein